VALSVSYRYSTAHHPRVEAAWRFSKALEPTTMARRY